MLAFLKTLLTPFDPMESGVVIAKQHLQAAAAYVPHSVMVGKSVAPEMSREPAENSYLLTVKGVTKHGLAATHELYVSAPEFGHYDIGDVWKRDSN